MPRFEINATNDSGGGEGPFFFTAATAEEAAEKYRDWAWSMVRQSDAPTPLKSGGPLPHVHVKQVGVVE